LVANDELDKRHWLQKLNAAVKSGHHAAHNAPALNTRQQSGKKVGRADSGSCCDDVDASFSSVGSSSSLTSSFSLNSLSTLSSVRGKFMSNCAAATVRDADADSGIIS